MTSLQRTVEAQVAGGLVPGAVALVADGDDITAVAAGVRAVGGAPGWATVPAFPAGAGGLVSTADDWCTFGRMLLAGGEHRGERILSADAVRQMMTSHVEAEPDNPFLEGHGWGFGGSVDLASTEPWNVPGRYGWIGATGTRPTSSRLAAES